MDRTALVAEVGGRHTHLALARPGDRRPVLQQLRAVPTPSGRLHQTLSDYLRGLPSCGPLETCAVAAAGRVQRRPERNFVNLTDARLTIDREDLQASGAARRLLLNELAAIASALPVLGPEELQALGPARVGAPGVQIVVRVAAGLGVAVLTADGALLETEAGHLDIAAVSAEERLWLNRLAPLGRLSVDQLLCANGLSRLYEAVGGSREVAPEAVVTRARSGEPSARKATIAFSTWFGRVVGNLILAYGAWGGVYMVGSLLESLGDAFDAPAFRQGMEDKAPLSSEIAAVPVYWVRHPHAALLGLARLALAN